jgi:1-acyl-sn-glycerol-3-phosphate acyltransferase
MTLKKQVVNTTVKTLTALLCKIDAEQLGRVPNNGPLIIVGNHVNFLDAPVLFTRLQPRPVTGFAKAETWDTPGLRLLFDTWEAIPIRRGEADVQAMRQGLAALEAGSIVGLAPEGTRSGHGRLQRGLGGIVLLAQRSGAPILPMVCYGAENYMNDWRRLRRVPFHVVVGHPFFLEIGDDRPLRAERQRITDEIMYQLAALLPTDYRGEYANLDAATETYLRFYPPSESNLRRARHAEPRDSVWETRRPPAPGPAECAPEVKVQRQGS